jgi:gas vesicle protein
VQGTELWQDNLEKEISYHSKLKLYAMHANSRIVLGLLAGAAAGAIAGILFAPDKGTETRRKISKATSDVGGNLKKRLDNMRGKEKSRYAGQEMEDVDEQSIRGYE